MVVLRGEFIIFPADKARASSFFSKFARGVARFLAVFPEIQIRMKRIFPLLFSILLPLSLKAQNSLYHQYIDRYKEMAVQQMHQYGIPASITLAQGLLESGAGTSDLARKANNHFGIKTGGTWTGPVFIQDDDAKNERFRRYRSVADSYEDHSLFLKNRQRYASLFTLSPTDYKGWAHGLKAAGYATNPEYAKKLIALIELYELYKFDKIKKTHAASAKKQHHLRDKDKRNETTVAGVASLKLRRCNETFYVLARQGDTFRSIALETGVSERRLIKYNEVDKSYRLKAGEPVFLEQKSSRVDCSLRKSQHTVKAGESLHAIAQSYGVRLERLYKANRLPASYAPRVGDRLKLN